jgi:hypothetical protein
MLMDGGAPRGVSAANQSLLFPRYQPDWIAPAQQDPGPPTRFRLADAKKRKASVISDAERKQQHVGTGLAQGVQWVGLVQKQLGLIWRRQDAPTLRKVKFDYAQNIYRKIGCVVYFVASMNPWLNN